LRVTSRGLGDVYKRQIRMNGRIVVANLLGKGRLPISGAISSPLALSGARKPANQVDQHRSTPRSPP
jgi:hypothetical protein